MTITIEYVWIVAVAWTVTEWFRAWRYGMDEEDLTSILIERVCFCATLHAVAWLFPGVNQ